jgi:hypothetical protein
MMYIAVVSDPAESAPVKAAGRFDLHLDATAIDRIEAARKHAPLRTFLANVNVNDSIFSSIGCKVWSTTEAAGGKPDVFASRIDLIFLQEAANFGRGPHENLANRLSELLTREVAEALRAELRISPVEFAGEDRGFCLRVILYARGATPEQAEVRWGLGLARLQQALLFIARGLRHQTEAGGRKKNGPSQVSRAQL